MIRSRTSPEPFNGAHDMVSFSASVDERTAAGPTEVILTARVANGSIWSTTIVVPPFTGRDLRNMDGEQDT